MKRGSKESFGPVVQFQCKNMIYAIYDLCHFKVRQSLANLVEGQRLRPKSNKPFHYHN